MGSFGIVKVLPAQRGDSDPAERWERKAGFHALAARYRQLADEHEHERGTSRAEVVEGDPRSALHPGSPPQPRSAREPGRARKPGSLGLPWRLGIVFTAVTVAMIALPWLVGLAGEHPPDTYHRAPHALRAVLTALALGGIALAACRWLDGRPVTQLGIAADGIGRKVTVGALAWLLPAALAYAVCAWVGLARIEPVVSPAALMTVVATQILLVLLLEALPEELVFRGYFFVNLRDRLGEWSTILAQAGLFTLWAVLIGAVDGLGRGAVLFGVGIGLGYLRSATGSIWPCVGFHLAFQTAAQLLSETQVRVATVDNLTLLEVVAYGILPFAVGLPLVASLLQHRARELPS
ncbi:MAG: CPBP family intramembrane glutamic endopeptidase [Propionibacteriaceae bacterium]